MNNIDRLYSVNFEQNNSIDYKQFIKESFNLSNGQIRTIENGLIKNLIISGGPGTGKTTSVLFLLVSLLKLNKNSEVYLLAPSGKASDRMKESIIDNLKNLNDEFKLNNKDIIDKINSLEKSTIHKALGINPSDGTFKHNKNNQFKDNSIFIIDEASMIDISLFSSLLESIPDRSRVFVMGDKNQLPSVEAGAVLNDLLNKNSLKDNIVELDESQRFDKNTDIYKLAEAINKNKELPITENEWESYKKFAIKETSSSCPIFYYSDQLENANDKVKIEYIIDVWSRHFYSSLHQLSSNLDYFDINSLNAIYNQTLISRILTAENEGNRGNKIINKLIKKKCFNSLDNCTGEFMMINKNNSMLQLDNGDNGIVVSFKDDPTLYFMIKKSSNIVSKEGYNKDHIFKISDYLFYPLRMIPKNEIDDAYCISIHKSQGSDYKNILVILPKQKGHPLVNRQIVYTAITRTKGNTYIYSNQERLEEASAHFLKRITNIK